MKRLSRAIFGALLLWSFPSAGQVPGSVELGLDAGFNVSFVDDSDQELFSIGLPAADFSSLLQNVRAGIPVSQRGTVESSLGFSALDDGYTTYWRLGIGMDYLYLLSAPSCGSSPFVRLGGIFNVLGSSRKSDAQVGVATGAGFKLMVGQTWGTRFEAGIVRMFRAGELPGRWDMTGSVGLSFFVR